MAIIKTCKIHGDLDETQVYITDRPYPSGKIGKRINCKQCDSDKTMRSYWKHREKRLATAKDWQARHPDQKKENRKRWGIENKEWTREYRKKHDEIMRKKALGWYIRRLLKKQGLGELITNDLVSLKSSMILLKRQLKKINTNE